jgi:large conductance mechanosensitive channel
MLAPHTPTWGGDFKKFIMRGNVVDLAVGIIIGAAFTAVVGSLVKDVITPVIGLLTGGIDFANIFITLHGGHFATLEEAKKAGVPTMNVGLFLNAIIQFLIVSFSVFWMVRVLTHLKVREDAAPAPTKTEVLLTEIRDLMKAKSEG